MEEKIILIEDAIKPYLMELNLELADIEFVKDGSYNYLRVYIEKINGNTTLDDCIEFSNKIENTVDEYIKEKYFLEVSTPGIERKLKKEKDFLRFINEKISVKTKINIENKKNFYGILSNFLNGEIIIFDEELAKEIIIPIEKIKQAKLMYDLSENIFKEEK